VSGSDDGTCILYDISTRKRIQTFNAIEGFGYNRVCLSANGDTVYGAHDRGMKYKVNCLVHSTIGIDIWRVKTGKALHCIPSSNRVSCIALSPDGSMLLAGCWDSYIRVITIILIPLTVS
jgi:WD40 repeat protein